MFQVKYKDKNFIQIIVQKNAVNTESFCVKLT
jgi:hypothetical protein